MNTAKIFAFSALFFSFAAGAQKIGTVNEESLLYALPEIHKIDTLLQVYQRDSVGAEYERLVAEYHQKDSIVRVTKNNSVKDSTQRILTEITRALQNWQQIAEQANSAKRAELLNPLYRKVRNAITAYAKEKGYSYIFQKNATLISPNTADITTAVALKLGIKKSP